MVNHVFTIENKHSSYNSTASIPNPFHVTVDILGYLGLLSMVSLSDNFVIFTSESCPHFEFWAKNVYVFAWVMQFKLCVTAHLLKLINNFFVLTS